MNIKIKGNSGCDIEVIGLQGRYKVKKSTSEGNYIPRLRKQKEKQEIFYQKNNLNYIIIPKIHGDYRNDTTYCFYMDYYNCNDYVTHLQISSKYDIDLILSRIIAFIEGNIKSCTIKAVKKEVFLEKYSDIRQKIMLNPLLTDIKTEIAGKLDKIVFSIDDYTGLPLGPCHGDLTFSNILFGKDCLVLIDFLDNFIETPLQDIVKVRQDTCFNWSLNFIESDYDKTRLLLIMKYIDEKIHNHFKKYDFYLKHYNLFQLFNFLRILPYAKSPEICRYLKITLRRLINDGWLDFR
ncbi:MAG: hypothetical protein H7844_10320 [Nitrospirae bacterium YQR-1]